MTDLQQAQEWGGLAIARSGLASDDPDEALLRLARSGDSGAIQDLLARHEAAIFRLCFGMLTCREDAEDAAQETFVRALTALSRFRGESGFRTWLVRIGINVCLERRRSRIAAANGPLPGGAKRESVPSPEQDILVRLHANDALRSLLPRHRALIVLKEVDGWTIAEIAEAVGWKPKRVENELFRARRALADWRQRQLD